MLRKEFRHFLGKKVGIGHITGRQSVPFTKNDIFVYISGLCIRTKLERNLVPGSVKLDIFVKSGTHSTVGDINKQINDKVTFFGDFDLPCFSVFFSFEIDFTFGEITRKSIKNDF